MFRIINFVCRETYRGLFTFTDIRKTNSFVRENIMKDLERYYGTGRKVISEIPEKHDDFFSPYIFTAWLSDDNPGNLKDEDGTEYEGRDLFVIGLSKNIDEVIDDIKRMGDKYFEKEARGFFY